MKCERCGASNANTHVKTIINGELREYDLCSECAHKLGYTNVFSDMESDFSHLLGSFFGNVLDELEVLTKQRLLNQVIRTQFDLRI